MGVPYISAFEFRLFLALYGACADGMRYVAGCGKNARFTYEHCNASEWLLWLIRRTIGGKAIDAFPEFLVFDSDRIPPDLIRAAFPWPMIADVIRAKSIELEKAGFTLPYTTGMMED